MVTPAGRNVTNKIFGAEYAQTEKMTIELGNHDSSLFGNDECKTCFYVPPHLQALSVHSDVSSRSVSRAVSSPVPPEELSPTAGGIGGFPVFGGGYPSALSHLEEGGFEQEEGKAEVTCM